jgi:hypothetical protein
VLEQEQYSGAGLNLHLFAAPAPFCAENDLFAAVVLFQCTKSEDFRPSAGHFSPKLHLLLRGLVIATDLGLNDERTRIR